MSLFGISCITQVQVFDFKSSDNTMLCKHQSYPLWFHLLAEKLISTYIEHLKHHQTLPGLLRKTYNKKKERKKKYVPKRPHSAKAQTIASEQGFTNFIVLISRNRPRMQHTNMAHVYICNKPARCAHVP